MKTICTALAFLAASFAAPAQSQTAPAAATIAPAADAYTNMMAATIAELLQAKDAAGTQQALDKLGRAAAARPADWLPRYYLAYGATRLAFQTGEADADAKDKTLDRAQADLDLARKLRGDESELQVLQAYILQGRIMVSPMMRGMKYTAKVQESLAAAEKANPANPRVYLLRGNDFYFRPAMFGGGAEAARPHFLQAREAYAAFKPASALAPNWGQNHALGLLKKIDADAAKASAR